MHLRRPQGRFYSGYNSSIAEPRMKHPGANSSLPEAPFATSTRNMGVPLAITVQSVLPSAYDKPVGAPD